MIKRFCNKSKAWKKQTKRSVFFTKQTNGMGSVIGSLHALGLRDMSSTEKGVVSVIYGRSNPHTKNPDVYPTPHFLLLKEPGPGTLKLRTGHEERRETRGGTGVRSDGLFSPTSSDLKGRHVESYQSSWTLAEFKGGRFCPLCEAEGLVKFICCS